MDFITNLPPSHGFDTLLVVVNCLSKQSHFIPTTWSLDAPGLAQLYISTVFKLHGVDSKVNPPKLLILNPSVLQKQ